MPIRDDEQFEKYLKQFCPLEPEPLMLPKQVKIWRRPVVFTACAAVAAVLFLLAMISMRSHKPAQPAQAVGTDKPSVQQSASPQPLTIARANALLAHAPSFKIAVDSMAFRPESNPISEGRYSALALLSEEETKQ
ncbi:MAG TPA: hypothetical protein VJW20_12245 [Candidatus Angelobacter sp.]|nr:hypothetical protein [Candidatus Angelobacter sp.]